METARACDILIESESLFGHCGIVTGNINGNPAKIPKGSMVIHATLRGVSEDMWRNGKALCYRPKHLNLGEAKRIQVVAERIKGAQYSICRAIFKSWSGLSVFDDGAFDRLQKYRSRLKAGQTVIKNVYCSELVVVSYQLGLNIDNNNRSWINLDAKHALPSTLKVWFEQNSNNWECVGEVRDESLAINSV